MIEEEQGRTEPPEATKGEPFAAATSTRTRSAASRRHIGARRRHRSPRPLRARLLRHWTERSSLLTRRSPQSRAGNRAPDQRRSRGTRSRRSTPPAIEDEPKVQPRFVAPIAIVTNLLNAALAPFLNPTPGQPAPQNPVLWAALAFVRRQFQDTPFGKVVLNRAPVGGDQEIDPVTGDRPCMVDVNATDPDGDQVQTVSATNGAHGTVTVNGDGTVTYDPRRTYEGTDTFYVTVSDEASGFHLHGLGGLSAPPDTPPLFRSLWL